MEAKTKAKFTKLGKLFAQCAEINKQKEELITKIIAEVGGEELLPKTVDTTSGTLTLSVRDYRYDINPYTAQAILGKKVFMQYAGISYSQFVKGGGDKALIALEEKRDKDGKPLKDGKVKSTSRFYQLRKKKEVKK